MLGSRPPCGPSPSTAHSPGFGTVRHVPDRTVPSHHNETSIHYFLWCDTLYSTYWQVNPQSLGLSIGLPIAFGGDVGETDFAGLNLGLLDDLLH